MRRTFVLLVALALVPGVMAASALAAPAPKVDVCHYDADGGVFHKINISGNALDAHIAHGDAVPGEPVPTAAGYQFDSDCAPVAVLFRLSTIEVSGVGWPSYFTVEEGRAYELRASGTYSWGDENDPNHPLVGDAQCVSIAGGAYFANYSPVPMLEVTVDESDGSWQPSGCDPLHQYTASGVGDGDVHSLRILDAGPVPYGDNSGFISVEIWLLP